MSGQNVTSLRRERKAFADMGQSHHSIPVSDTRTIGIVEDSDKDFFILETMLSCSDLPKWEIWRYQSVDALLAEKAVVFDVVILDRILPEGALSESRIREVRAKFNNCGVILHTGHVTFSLRSAAAHQGAVAVLEKGRISRSALALIVETAAILGPQIQMPGEWC